MGNKSVFVLDLYQFTAIGRMHAQVPLETFQIPSIHYSKNVTQIAALS